MDLTTLLTPQSRVLDVDVRSPALARDLAALGIFRYLGLVRRNDLVGAREAAGDLAARFHPWVSVSEASRCSTDLLVLRRGAERLAWSLFDMARVDMLAIERSRSGLPTSESLLATVFGRARGRARELGRYSSGASVFDVFQISSLRRESPRLYLSRVLGVRGFAERLALENVDYAVLRWFENLPHIEPGEDLDLLVADEHLALVRSILAEEPGTIPVDLYSETGLAGAAYRDAAYYPPPLARGLLDRAVMHESGCRVPAPLDHFHSMAYHAVYHKGLESGLGKVNVGDPEHDYSTVLTSLAGRVGVEFVATLEAVDQYLSSVGWRPPEDTLRRLSTNNTWVREVFFADTPLTREPPELAVFLLREHALAHVTMDEVSAVLDHFGFEVLTFERLSADASKRCAALARGGNWGRGPFPVSGGPPAAVAVTLHYHPRRPSERDLERYPHLTNQDVLFAKNSARDLVNGRIEVHQRFNAIHSSDNEVDAWQYLELTMPERIAEIQSRAEIRRAQYRDIVGAVEVLSFGRRSVVTRPRVDRVRKTFYPPFTRFAEREVHAYATLAPAIPKVPTLLDSGPGWLEIPYFENRLGEYSGRQLVPLGTLREMIDVLRRVHEAGYELVDARPENFVLDPVYGLKILDFEFLRPRTDGGSGSILQSATFLGPADPTWGDTPVGRTDYTMKWQTQTGLSIEALINGTKTAQVIQRARFRSVNAITGRGSLPRRAAKLGRQQVRTLRQRAALLFTSWVRRRIASVGP